MTFMFLKEWGQLFSLGKKNILERIHCPNEPVAYVSPAPHPNHSSTLSCGQSFNKPIPQLIHKQDDIYESTQSITNA